MKADTYRRRMRNSGFRYFRQWYRAHLANEIAPSRRAVRAQIAVGANPRLLDLSTYVDDVVNARQVAAQFAYKELEEHYS